VRHGPNGVDNGGTTELTEGAGAGGQWRKDGVAAAVRLAGADTRPRKERRGWQIARACTHEG
jgi:hypothetical protein